MNYAWSTDQCLQYLLHFNISPDVIRKISLLKINSNFLSFCDDKVINNLGIHEDTITAIRRHIRSFNHSTIPFDTILLNMKDMKCTLPVISHIPKIHHPVNRLVNENAHDVERTDVGSATRINDACTTNINDSKPKENSGNMYVEQELQHSSSFELEHMDLPYMENTLYTEGPSFDAHDEETQGQGVDYFVRLRALASKDISTLLLEKFHNVSSVSGIVHLRHMDSLVYIAEERNRQEEEDEEVFGDEGSSYYIDHMRSVSDSSEEYSDIGQHFDMLHTAISMSGSAGTDHSEKLRQRIEELSRVNERELREKGRLKAELDRRLMINTESVLKARQRAHVFREAALKSKPTRMVCNTYLEYSCVLCY
jgi:hypothetical protein